jgi:hypothetical protein
MKTIHKLILVLTIILMGLLAFPRTVSAAPVKDDRIVIGESYTLETGRILDGDLNVIGGVVEIKEAATVNGNVFVLGGLVTINGTINGNLTAIGGTVNLSETAVLQGDLITPASYININPNARILGEQKTPDGVTGIGTEQLSNLRNQLTRSRPFGVISILTQIGKFLTYTLVLFALGALLILIMPYSADRMVTATRNKPWHLFGYGTLTTIVMFSVLFLSITICLIPFVLLVGLVYVTALLVGWLALGYLLGKRTTNDIFNKTWHPVLTGAFGNLILYLIALGVSQIPCVGWFPVFIAMLFGLGMVVATLFGTYSYPRIPCEDKESEQVVLFDKSAPKEAVISTSTEPGATKPTPEVPLDFEEDTTFEREMKEDLPEKPTETAVTLSEVPVAEVIAKPEVPIELLNLGARMNNVLIDAGYTTVDDVLTQLELGDDALLEINGFGEKSLSDLKKALLASGYIIP